MIDLLGLDPISITDRYFIEPAEGGALVPFHPTDVQRDFLPKVWEAQKTGPSYHVVLKARRMGISSGVQFLAYAKLVTTKNYVVSVISHDEASAKLISRFWRLFWELQPTDVRRHLVCSPTRCPHRLGECAFRVNRWDEHWEMTWGSRLYIFTAGSANAARAYGAQFIHLSEAAFYPDAGTLMKALMPTLPKNQPGCVVVVESTGAGAQGWFFETYKRAKEAESERKEGKNVSFLFRPHFYPWYADSRYRIEGMELGTLSEEEEYLRRLGCDDAQLAFRRYAVENEFGGDEDSFRQEYPTTEEDAFLKGDLSIFPYARLKAQLQDGLKPTPSVIITRSKRLVAAESPSSKLWIYEQPQPRGRYLIGADPAVVATKLSDYAAAVVWGRKGTRLCVMATLELKADVETFGKELITLAKFYNNATICPERNSGAGRHLISYLLQKGYGQIWQDREMVKKGVELKETLGWATTRVSKEMLISEMVADLYESSISLNCPRLIRQLMDFVKNPKGRERWGPASPSGHDDLAMAAMIGLAAWKIGAPKEVVDTSAWQTYLDTLRRLRVGV